MEEPNCPRRTRRGARAFAQDDHRATSVCRKNRLSSDSVHEPQSQCATIKIERALKISGAQMHLADADFVWQKGIHVFHLSRCICFREAVVASGVPKPLVVTSIADKTLGWR